MNSHRNLYKVNGLLIKKPPEEKRNELRCIQKAKRSEVYDFLRKMPYKIKKEIIKNTKRKSTAACRCSRKKIVIIKNKPFVVGVVRHKIHSPPFLHEPIEDRSTIKKRNQQSTVQSFAPKNYKFRAPKEIQKTLAILNQSSPFTLKSLFNTHNKQNRHNTKKNDICLTNVTFRPRAKKLIFKTPPHESRIKKCDREITKEHCEQVKKIIWPESPGSVKESPEKKFIFGRLNLLKASESKEHLSEKKFEEEIVNLVQYGNSSPEKTNALNKVTPLEDNISPINQESMSAVCNIVSPEESILFKKTIIKKSRNNKFENSFNTIQASTSAKPDVSHKKSIEEIVYISPHNRILQEKDTQQDQCLTPVEDNISPIKQVFNSLRSNIGSSAESIILNRNISEERDISQFDDSIDDKQVSPATQENFSQKKCIEEVVCLSHHKTISPKNNTQFNKVTPVPENISPINVVSNSLLSNFGVSTESIISDRKISEKSEIHNYENALNRLKGSSISQEDISPNKSVKEVVHLSQQKTVSLGNNTQQNQCLTPVSDIISPINLASNSLLSNFGASAESIILDKNISEESEINIFNNSLDHEQALPGSQEISSPNKSIKKAAPLAQHKTISSENTIESDEVTHAQDNVSPINLVSNSLLSNFGASAESIILDRISEEREISKTDNSVDRTQASTTSQKDLSQHKSIKESAHSSQHKAISLENSIQSDKAVQNISPVNLVSNSLLSNYGGSSESIVSDRNLSEKSEINQFENSCNITQASKSSKQDLSQKKSIEPLSHASSTVFSNFGSSVESVISSRDISEESEMSKVDNSSDSTPESPTSNKYLSHNNSMKQVVPLSQHKTILPKSSTQPDKVTPVQNSVSSLNQLSTSLLCNFGSSAESVISNRNISDESEISQVDNSFASMESSPISTEDLSQNNSIKESVLLSQHKRISKENSSQSDKSVELRRIPNNVSLREEEANSSLCDSESSAKPILRNTKQLNEFENSSFDFESRKSSSDSSQPERSQQIEEINSNKNSMLETTGNNSLGARTFDTISLDGTEASSEGVKDRLSSVNSVKDKSCSSCKSSCDSPILICYRCQQFKNNIIPKETIFNCQESLHVVPMINISSDASEKYNSSFHDKEISSEDENSRKINLKKDVLSNNLDSTPPPINAILKDKNIAVSEPEYNSEESEITNEKPINNEKEADKGLVNHLEISDRNISIGYLNRTGDNVSDNLESESLFDKSPFERDSLASSQNEQVSPKEEIHCNEFTTQQLNDHISLTESQGDSSILSNMEHCKEDKDSKISNIVENVHDESSESVSVSLSGGESTEQLPLSESNSNGDRENIEDNKVLSHSEKTEKILVNHLEMSDSDRSLRELNGKGSDDNLSNNFISESPLSQNIYEKDVLNSSQVEQCLLEKEIDCNMSLSRQSNQHTPSTESKSNNSSILSNVEQYEKDNDFTKSNIIEDSQNESNDSICNSPCASGNYKKLLSKTPELKRNGTGESIQKSNSFNCTEELERTENLNNSNINIMGNNKSDNFESEPETEVKSTYQKEIASLSKTERISSEKLSELNQSVKVAPMQANISPINPVSNSLLGNLGSSAESIVLNISSVEESSNGSSESKSCTATTKKETYIAVSSPTKRSHGSEENRCNNHSHQEKTHNSLIANNNSLDNSLDCLEVISKDIKGKLSNVNHINVKNINNSACHSPIPICVRCQQCKDDIAVTDTPLKCTEPLHVIPMINISSDASEKNNNSLHGIEISSDEQNSRKSNVDSTSPVVIFQNENIVLSESKNILLDQEITCETDRGFNIKNEPNSVTDKRIYVKNEKPFDFVLKRGIQIRITSPSNSENGLNIITRSIKKSPEIIDLLDSPRTPNNLLLVGNLMMDEKMEVKENQSLDESLVLSRNYRRRRKAVSKLSKLACDKILNTESKEDGSVDTKIVKNIDIVNISDSPADAKENRVDVVDLVSEDEEDSLAFLSRIMKTHAKSMFNSPETPGRIIAPMENIPMIRVSPTSTPLSKKNLTETSPLNSMTASPVRVLSLRNRPVNISPSPMKTTPKLAPVTPRKAPLPQNIKETSPLSSTTASPIRVLSLRNRSVNVSPSPKKATPKLARDPPINIPVPDEPVVQESLPPSTDKATSPIRVLSLRNRPVNISPSPMKPTPKGRRKQKNQRI